MNAPQSSEKVKSCSKRHFYPSPPSRVPQQNIGRCPKDGGVKYTNKNPFLSFHLYPEETVVSSVFSCRPRRRSIPLIFGS